MRRIALLLVFLLLAARAEETQDFSDVAEAGLALVDKHGADRVLMVFDIDNTLLTMDQDLGGDAWFNWQAGLLRKAPKSPFLVAGDFRGLLRVQGILFSLGGMHPPEKSTPASVRKLQSTGARLFALSSRGPEYFSATLRVLQENGYDLSTTAWPGRPGTFLPVADAEERERWALSDPRPVLHQSGVYLAAGQHKGAILRELWAKAKRKHTALLFVDDHEKHVKRVRAAFEGEDVELKLFRYARMDAAVERFRKSDKKDVDRKWRTLKAAMDAVLAGR